VFGDDDEVVRGPDDADDGPLALPGDVIGSGLGAGLGAGPGADEPDAPGADPAAGEDE
jgi:hypothetical protein